MNSLFALSSLTDWGERSNEAVLMFSVGVDGVSRGAGVDAGEHICIIILKINSDSEKEMTLKYSLLL